MSIRRRTDVIAILALLICLLAINLLVGWYVLVLWWRGPNGELPPDMPIANFLMAFPFALVGGLGLFPAALQLRERGAVNERRRVLGIVSGLVAAAGGIPIFFHPISWVLIALGAVSSALIATSPLQRNTPTAETS